MAEAPLLREHRLYQADWLMRFYSFTSDEILDETRPDLDEELDPKSGWALRHLEFYPVEVNAAGYETLLRVPGIGVKSARRILTARRSHSLWFDDLKKIGVVLKRAKYFITCRGRYFAQSESQPEDIRRNIRTSFRDPEEKEAVVKQLPLFTGDGQLAGVEDALTSVSGEL
jgi:predicted DNA-binding helix-hairpin-helix protein